MPYGAWLNWLMCPFMTGPLFIELSEGIGTEAGTTFEHH
jgi:hypothetical protein